MEVRIVVAKIAGGRGPLSSQRIADIEKRLGVNLPSDYRAFMLEHNGGVPHPADFTFADEIGPYTDGSVVEFYSIQEDEAERGLLTAYRMFCSGDPRMPRDVIPIASELVGNQICLCVTGQRAGYVYFWDHENECEGEPTYDNMHLLARSFTEFLARLT
jgi:hypothetical protein